MNDCNDAAQATSTLSEIQDRSDAGILNITEKSLGLDDVGTDTGEIVKKLDNAIDRLQSYQSAISNTLGSKPTETSKVLDVKA